MPRPNDDVENSVQAVSSLKELIIFVKANSDVFTWLHEDMMRIDPDVCCHLLNIVLNTQLFDNRCSLWTKKGIRP